MGERHKTHLTIFDGNLLHIDRKVNDKFENILKLEAVEIIELPVAVEEDFTNLSQQGDGC